MADYSIGIGNTIQLGNGVSGTFTYVGWDTLGWDTFGWDGDFVSSANASSHVTPANLNNVVLEYLQDGSPDFYVFPTPVSNVVSMVTAPYSSTETTTTWSASTVSALTYTSGSGASTNWSVTTSVTTTWS